MPIFLRTCFFSLGLLAVGLLQAQEVEITKTNSVAAASAGTDDDFWLSRSWDTVSNTYTQGKSELYVPLITYHARWAYSHEQIESYQERPPGLGYGRGLYDEKGNWHGVYAMGFQDSHYKPEWVVGYSWKAMWGDRSGWQAGLGYTAGFTARSDIGNYTPVPLVLPIAAVSYRKLALEATYVPGGKGFGNVLFIWGKWSFGD